MTGTVRVRFFARYAELAGCATTSVELPLTKFNSGTWFYRVRGINEALPVGARAMTWSPIVRIKITGDRFTIVK